MGDRAMERLQAQAQAFQQLLGLEALPANGPAAERAARGLAAAVAAAAPPPPPALSALLEAALGGGAAAGGGGPGAPPPRQRFQDVATGMRLRYLDWGAGAGGEDVVLLLHDLGEAAPVWGPIAHGLKARGYRPIAIDLRGHGGSSRSPDARYSAGVLAEDVKALITALDLYVRPLAVVDAGAGGSVALALAQHWPRLVGALALLEFTVPAALLARGGGDAGGGAGSAAAGGHEEGGAAGAAPAAHALGICGSAELLPWWSFHPAQGAAFYSGEEAAAFLSHPLANLSPSALLPLAAAAAAAMAALDPGAAAPGGPGSAGSGAGADLGGAGGEGASAAARAGGDAGGKGEGGASPDSHVLQQEEGAPAGAADPAAVAAAEAQAALAGLRRPAAGVARSVCAVLAPPPAWGGWGPAGWPPGEGPAAGGAWPSRVDPRMMFSFEPSELAAGMRALPCHLLLLTGAPAAGGWCPPEDAAAMAGAAAAGAAASAAAAAVPGAGHRLAADAPEAVLSHLVAFLEGPALLSLQPAPPPAAARQGGEAGAGGAADRRPEVLGLRPLPQYASLEEAQKALGPRRLPTAAAVEEALARLRAEEGGGAPGAGSEDEGSDESPAGPLELGGEGGRGGAARGRLGRYQTALAQNPPDYFGFVG